MEVSPRGDGGGPPARTTSALSTGTTHSDATAAVVSASLEGLVSAVDELKRSMGLGDSSSAQLDFAAVEEFVLRLRLENEEFRQFAEQAIMSAQRLRDERDALEARLEQAGLERSMDAALAEAAKLRGVADELERDLTAQRLAEATARAGEAEALRERVAELEEENAGLTLTLNEFRQTTQQLQKLQSHEVRRLQKAERGGGSTKPSSDGEAADAGPALAAAAGGGVALGVTAAAALPSAPPSVSAGSSPRVASAVSGTPAFRSVYSPGSSPKPLAPAALPSPQALEAVRLAEELEEVSGGANSGLLATAALTLRQLSERDAALVQAQQDNARLRGEVEELSDTMFSKTFKAPSAWAEREVKYKTERKEWEEQHKELAARHAALAAELAAQRGASGAQQLEERVQELEAALVQSEREKDGVRAQLHELQLSLRGTEGEFDGDGKRSPYKSPLGAGAAEGHEVQQMVGLMEHGKQGGATSTDPTAAAQRRQSVDAQLAAAAGENAALRRQLAEQQLVTVPITLHSELGPVATAAAVLATATQLEGRLHEAEAARSALQQRQQQQQGALGSSAVDGTDDDAAVAVAQAEAHVQELEARAEAAEAAGQGEEAGALRRQAQQLQQMGAALRRAEEEQAALALTLAQLKPLHLQISVAAAAEGAASGSENGAADSAAEEQVVEVPQALQAELGGAVLPAAAVEAKAVAVEAALAEAAGRSTEMRQQLRRAVALEAAAAAAAATAHALEAQLEAREGQQQAAAPGDAAEAGAGRQGEDAGDGVELAALRRQLAAALQQREVAQQQLWQLAELQEQVQRSDAERRRLQAQLAAASQPVNLRLAVAARDDDGGEDGERLGAGSEESERLLAELAAAQQHSSDLRAQLAAVTVASATAAAVEPTVRLALQVGDADAAALQQAEAEVARLRSQLADLQPVRLQLAVHGDGAADTAGNRPSSSSGAVVGGASPSRRSLDPSPGDAPLLGRVASEGSMGALVYSSEQASALSRERAAADAAWQEHQKASDVPSLLRAKAELETRCQMLESQVAKLQQSGVNGGGNEGESRPSFGKRMFKRAGGGAGGTPSKDTLRNTVHEMQDALTSCEEEKNALKRQLAKLSKKYQAVTAAAAHTAGIVAGAQAVQLQQRQEAEEPSAAASDETESAGDLALLHDDDSELELLKMREEGAMLMEHLVMVKVRHAEMEGDYLEAKRQLARTREKNMQLARKLAELREAAERGDPLPFTPRQGGGGAGGAFVTSTVTPLRDNAAAAGAAGGGATPPSEQRKLGGLLARIPGLGSP